MKQIAEKSFAVFIFSLLVVGFTFAQTNKKAPPTDLYVISAKAGGVNFVSGSVFVYHRNGTKSDLTKGMQLERSDKVKSSFDGKAEILLNPGSFVRLAENSEFQFVTTSLDSLQVKINRGSAIFEIVAAKDFQVGVRTPKSGFSIVKSGIYRVDVDESGTAKVEVWKGKAQIENASATILKSGQTTSIDEQQIVVSKFDRDKKDAFELWSKSRAKELAKLNEILIARQVNQSLLTYSNGFGYYSGSGVWIQDPFSRISCFFPFNYGYNSPYGYSYNQSFYNYQNNTNFNSNQNSQNNSNQPYYPNDSQNNRNNSTQPIFSNSQINRSTAEPSLLPAGKVQNNQPEIVQPARNEVRID